MRKPPAQYLAELVEVVDKLAVVLVPAKHVFTVILLCLHPANKGGKYRQLCLQPFANSTLVSRFHNAKTTFFSLIRLQKGFYSQWQVLKVRNHLSNL